MILPTKHVPVERSLLGTASTLLRLLAADRTVSSLWESARGLGNVRSFDRFVLALDLLFVLGAVSYHDGNLRRSR